MARTNLISNGGFESNLNGWNDYQGRGSEARVTTERQFGAASMQVTCTTGGSDYGVFSQLGIPLGTALVHSAYVKGEGTAIGKLIIIYIQSQSTWTHTYTLTGSWQRIDVYSGFSGSPVLTTTQPINLFILQVGAVVGDVFYVDGVQLEVGNVATAYIETDGRSITVDDEVMTASLWGQRHVSGTKFW